MAQYPTYTPHDTELPGCPLRDEYPAPYPGASFLRLLNQLKDHGHDPRQSLLGPFLSPFEGRQLAIGLNGWVKPFSPMASCLPR